MERSTSKILRPRSARKLKVETQMESLLKTQDLGKQSLLSVLNPVNNLASHDDDINGSSSTKCSESGKRRRRSTRKTPRRSAKDDDTMNGSLRRSTRKTPSKYKSINEEMSAFVPEKVPNPISGNLLAVFIYCL